MRSSILVRFPHWWDSASSGYGEIASLMLRRSTLSRLSGGVDLGANELGSVEAILGLSQLATLSFQDNYIDLTAADLIESLATLSGRGTSVRAEPQRDLGFWATSEDGR